MSQPVHRRVIVKLSGEALAGNQGSGIDQATIDRVAADLVAAQKLGIQIGVVVGGGNIFRGVEVSSRGVSRQTGDMMGMLATVMNGLALEAAIERAGVQARSLSALTVPQVCESYSNQRARKHLDAGRIARLRAAMPGGAQGYQCGRRLQRRPQARPGRQAL
jgi:uridylate kinase